MSITYLVEHVTEDGPIERREFSGRGSRQAAIAYARGIAEAHRLDIAECETNVTRGEWRRGCLDSTETWSV